MDDFEENFNFTLDNYDMYENVPITKGLNVRNLILLCVVILMTLGNLVCNGLVFGVVVKRPRLHNFPYIIIACIAIIDILTSFAQIYEIFLWYGLPIIQEIYCKLVSFLLNLLSLLTALYLTSLALMLWKAKSSLKFGKEKDVKKSLLVVFFIFLFSAIVSYPAFHLASLINNGYEFFCVFDSPFPSAFLIYSSIIELFKCLICLLILIPSLVMAKKNRKKVVVEVDEEGEVMQDKKLLDKRFENMILIVSIIFVLLTVSTYSLINFYHNDYRLEVISLLTYLHGLYKFFLYRKMDTNFRNEFSALFTRSV